MGDNASLITLNDQPPVIRLLLSLFFTVLTGTVFFWIFLFCGSLIFGEDISAMLQIPDQGAGQREINILRFVQVSQQAGLFLVPAVLLAILLKKKGESFVMMNRAPEISSIVLVSALVVLIIPVTAWTGLVNSKLDFPDWLPGIETLIREKEEKATAITGFLIGSKDSGGLFTNIFVLAVLPAFAEELLFRGIFQQLFIKLFRSSHAGIWITAIVFSAVHFQFFGFLPRLLLGLVFGYIFFWTGNLWPAVIMHFLNNSIPVVLTFFSAVITKPVKGEAEEVIFPFMQLILAGIIMYYFWWSFHGRKR
jgi:membrane protease YdiL (CAAX protease family)